jgi:cell division protein FtsW (lipid II flippase)
VSAESSSSSPRGLSTQGVRIVVWTAYVVALLGLIATDFSPLGLVMGGVRRWAKLGPVQFQFSELAKIALVGVMADYWSRAGRNAPKKLGPWIVTALLSLPVVGLVFLQPHFSAASLLFLLPFFVAFYAGAAWQSLAKIVVPLVVLAIVGVSLCAAHKMPFLKEYQQDRIAAHFGGASDEQGSNYQALQGQRALMRGGLLGSGPGGSLYKQGHLPAPHTDFILAVTGEEWGLVGMVALLGGYGLAIFFCFHAGHCAASPFEALICSGMGTLLAIQVLCNAGVVTGVLPVTGMPLPLLSFGGSGMVCTLLGIGLVLSATRRFNCGKNPNAS